MSADNRRILIIDDERPILMTLEALLGRHGYQPEIAANAAAGMRVLQSKTPALVLLDLQLPDADGLQLLEQIKTDHPDTQVIILTAHDSCNNAIRSIERGAYHFISKPYAPEELLPWSRKRSKNSRSSARPSSCAKRPRTSSSASPRPRRGSRRFSRAR